MDSKPVVLIPVLLALLTCCAGAAGSAAYQGFAEPLQSFVLAETGISFRDASDMGMISVSADDFAVYKYGYVSFDGKDWERFGLSGNALGGDWLNGSVSADVEMDASDFGLSVSRTYANRNFVVLYSCSRENGGWNCHGGWQIWQFSATLIPESQGVQVVGVSDSHHVTGNLPEKTLDGNLICDDGAWSAEGDGQWVSYELSDEAWISYVEFAFCYDTKRNFDVQLSNDSVQWVTALSGVWSRGANPDSLERFDLPVPVQARYVRFLGHGSNVSMWNALTEADINGFAVDIEEPACTSHSSSSCHDGDVWWYDSCGGREDVRYDCTSAQTCSGGQCVDNGGTGEAAIIYYNNFEQDEVGSYTTAERNADWSNCQVNPGESIYQNAADTENPSKVYKFFFPEGSWSLNNENGFRCKYYFPQGYDEVYFSYRVRLGNGFNPVLGGKLPRVEADADFQHLTVPGYCPNGSDSFTGGMMFDPDGSGGTYPRFYIYHPEQWNATWYQIHYYDITKTTITSCSDLYDNPNPDFKAALAAQGITGAAGTSFPWTRPVKTFNWNQIDTTGTVPASLGSGWHTITERISANTPGEHDGFAEGYIDGQMVSQVTGLRFRDVETLKLNWIDFVSFFGGGESWATVKDEYIYFDDIIAYYYLPGSGQPVGHQMRDPAQTLPGIPYPSQSVLSG